MGSDWDRDLADARAEGAAAERRAARRERELLSAEAIWADELEASVGAAVRLWCRSGRCHVGRVETCGDELVTVRSGAVLTAIRRDSVVAFETDGPAHRQVGRGHQVGMGDVLAEMADRQAAVSGWADGWRFSGVVLDVGEDVARLGRPDGAVAYVAVRSVTEVSVEASPGGSAS